MTSKEKIRDIKSVINEFYHNEKCEGKLTECARKSWLVFQEYCDDILQDIERLEEVKDELDMAITYNDSLYQENEKRKKVLEILNDKFLLLTYENKVLGSYSIEIIDMDKTICYMPLDQQEYELLKEVLSNEI